MIESRNQTSTTPALASRATTKSIAPAFGDGFDSSDEHDDQQTTSEEETDEELINVRTRKRRSQAAKDINNGTARKLKPAVLESDQSSEISLSEIPPAKRQKTLVDHASKTSSLSSGSRAPTVSILGEKQIEQPISSNIGPNNGSKTNPLVIPSGGSSSTALGSTKTNISSTVSEDGIYLIRNEDYEEQPVAWIDKYEPKTSEDIALHTAKKRDIRDVIQQITQPTSTIRVLILSGPAGTSKSSILKVAFKEAYQERFSSGTPTFIEYETPDPGPGVSLVHDFSNFLVGCRYRGNNQNSIILVEDLPNIAHYDTKRQFNNAVNDWIRRRVSNYEDRPPCLAIIITEVEADGESSSSSRNALSRYTNPSSIVTECVLIREILTSPKVRRIKFNKIAKTYLRKALKNIADKEKQILKSLSKNDLTRVLDALSLYGDIRSGINTFEYWARSISTFFRDVPTDSSLSKLELQKGLNQRTADFLRLMKRDVSLDLFRAIAKVIHRSMKDCNGIEGDDEEAALEPIINDWGRGSRGDQQSFENLLYENYLPVNDKIMSLDNVLQCLDSLEIGNSLVAKSYGYNSAGTLATELAFQIQVRGIRLAVKDAKHCGRQSFKNLVKLQAPQFLKKKGADIMNFQQEILDLQNERIDICKTVVGIDPLIQYEKFYIDTINKSYQGAPNTSARQTSMDFSDIDDTEFDEMVKDLEEEILSETKSNLDTPTDSSIIIPSSNPQLSNSKVAKASNSVPVLQPKMNPSNIILSRSAPLSAPASISKPTRSLGLAFPSTDISVPGPLFTSTPLSSASSTSNSISNTLPSQTATAATNSTSAPRLNSNHMAINHEPYDYDLSDEGFDILEANL